MLSSQNQEQDSEGDVSRAEGEQDGESRPGSIRPAKEVKPFAVIIFISAKSTIDCLKHHQSRARRLEGHEREAREEHQEIVAFQFAL